MNSLPGRAPPVSNSRATTLLHLLLPVLGALAFGASVQGATVSNTDDTGSGSLREAIATVETTADNDIHFDASLDGQTIVLTTGQLTITSTVHIFGSDLAHGITVSGNGATRIFQVDSGTLQLNRVHLTRGNAGAQDGGAVLVSGGTVALNECSLTDNAAAHGGALFGDGSGLLSVSKCTLSGNVADDTAALWVQDARSAFLSECTITMNRCTSAGGTGAIGRIAGSGSLTVVHCTVAGNSGGSTGGGIFTDAALNVERCIIAANTATAGAPADIFKNTGTVTPNGPSLIGSNQSVDGAGEFPTNSLHGTAAAPLDPQLGPLGLTGGYTRTLAPLSTSPALEAATGSSETLDQRGFPRPVGVADLGAVERGPLLIVLNNADTGANSLRARLAAATAPDTRIQFDSSLNGATITLTSAELHSNGGQSVELDASTLTAGLTISGGNTFRVINTFSGNNLSLNRLTLTGANSSDGFGGGAVYLQGNSLLAVDCTFRENASTTLGGALFISGAAADLHRCTLSANTANNGGAIWMQDGARVTLANSTIAGNRSLGSSAAGGIHNAGNVGDTLDIIHTTITGNTGTGGGGGLHLRGTGFVRVERSLIAGNHDSSSAKDISKISGTIIPIGNNLIGINDSVSTEFPTNSLHGTSGAPLDPRLGPLGLTGGYTRTLAPLSTSPALEAAAGSSEPRDQRGFPRPVGLADLGAVERGPLITVLNNADTGANSLRDTLAAATAPDTRIQFDSSLNGATITLTSAELALAGGQSVELDASTLTAGLTISGGNSFRVINTFGGNNLSLNRLTLTGGNSSDGFGGGAVFLQGNSLLAVDCTLSGNHSTSGGGALVLISAVADVHRCTLSENTAGNGGAAFEQGLTELSLTNCTVTGNHGTGNGTGGIVDIAGRLDLVHTTISGNTGTDHGGGLYVQSPAVVRVERSIIAANLDPSTIAQDIFKSSGALTPIGNNLIGINDSVTSEFPTNSLHGTSGAPVNPQLGPLGRYGGLTETIPLHPNSPARDQGTGSTLVVDQRSFQRPIGAAADLGAYEAGNLLTFGAWSEDVFGLALTQNGDNDHDGRSNFLEYATLTNPFVGDGGPILNFSRNTAGTQATLILPVRFGATDLFYVLERSTTLANWELVANFDPRTGIGATTGGVALTFGIDQLTSTDNFINGQSKVFYHLQLIEQ